MGKPEIRFKGFTDDWEQRKLGEVCQITMGQSPKGSTYSAEPSTYILVQGNADLKDGWVCPRVWTTQKTKAAEAGDFIMSVRAPAGAMGKTAYNVVLGRGVAGIKGNEFIYQTLVKMDADGYWKKLSAGSTFESINSDAITNADISLPQNVDEQEKIGFYFSRLDHLITLHQRKCDEVKTLKKYMLQKMFPQNGMNVPEIRFSGFTDVWEQRKLGEVIEDYVEKTTVENQYPVLTSSQQMGIVLQDDYFSGDRVSQSGNIGYFVIPRGYFAYRSRSDNDVFVFNRNDCIDKGSISYFYPVFKPSGVDSDFLLRRLNYGLETQLKIASEGTGQHVLSLKKFKNMTALFPSINEQRKIGEYFTRLDHLITLHQRKCDELRKMKKFMLQNMFPKD